MSLLSIVTLKTKKEFSKTKKSKYAVHAYVLLQHKNL